MESDRRRVQLSELPDSLILEILLKLDTRDAVRTTILSKCWKDLWTTIPRLDFWYEYRSFIGGALAKWKGDKIKDFFLAFEDDKTPATDIVDSWLLIPIDKQVERFRLCMEPDSEYCLPQNFFSCSSLTDLTLVRCNLKIDENVNVQWNQLKSLDIQEFSYLSGDAMNRILCGAPLLEELNLWSVDITENLNIRSTSLKKLQISRDDFVKSIVIPNTTVTVWAPNLLSFDISACVYGTCLLDVPSLTDAVIRFQEAGDSKIDFALTPLHMFDQLFRSLRHVEKLTLSDSSIQMLLEMKENHMVVRFSNAKFLKLCVYSIEAEGLLDVLGMFPQLMNFVVERNEDYIYFIDREPEVAMVDASEMTFPNPSLLQLKTVDITWYKCPTSIIPMVEIMLKNAHVLEKMVLQLRAGGSVSEEKIFTLAKMVMMSMPRSSPTAQVIIIKQ